MLFSKDKREQAQITKLCKKMKKVLKPHRYYHSLGVCYTAASLAMKYEANVHDAMVAGILHDCAKSYTGMELLAMCDKFGIVPSESERINPELLHAKIGSVLAKKKYSISNKEILDAISFHTTGRPQMALLEEILYIADYIEPSRDKAPNLNIIRKTAFEDIDKCVEMVATSTIEYLKSQNSEIDDTTEKTLEYYSKSNKGISLE